MSFFQGAHISNISGGQFANVHGDNTINNYDNKCDVKGNNHTVQYKSTIDPQQNQSRPSAANYTTATPSSSNTQIPNISNSRNDPQFSTSKDELDTELKTATLDFQNLLREYQELEKLMDQYHGFMGPVKDHGTKMILPKVVHWDRDIEVTEITRELERQRI